MALVENCRRFKTSEHGCKKGFIKILQESDDEESRVINNKNINETGSESDDNDFDKHFINFRLSSFN